MSAPDYPHNVTDVKAGLEALSAREALIAADELMARRPLGRKDRTFLISVLRRERLGWRDARDKREDAKDAD